MSERAGELEFPATRNQIETEIEAHLGAGPSVREVPALTYEKGETRFVFFPPHLENALVYEAIGLVKSCIENLRVHSFDPGFVVFQAMGENLFDTAAITSGIKFKFVSLGGTNRVEITRKGNWNQNEVQAAIQVFKLFHPREKRGNPLGNLARLGIAVYQKRAGDGTSTSGAASGDGANANATEAGADAGAITIADTWDSIAGYAATKLEIQENVILPLRHPEVFDQVARAAGKRGAAMPRAILFEGPPGVGKTTMARLIALETGLPLVVVPVENILSKYYGESAQNMAAIFDAAAELDRALLFLDEIDSLAGSREEGLVEATRRVLSVLLRKIDGFEAHPGLLTIGATNRSQDLDRALISRFDQTIHFPMPNASERGAIFSRYARHLTDAELLQLGNLSPGLSGRTIQDVCEYAERRWARLLIAEKKTITAPPAGLYQEIVRVKTEQVGASAS